MRKPVLSLLVALIALPAASQPDDAKAKRRAEIVAEATKVLAEQDSFAAIQFIENRDDPGDIITSYDALSQASYWQRKDLQPSIAMARAGIQFGLTTAPSIDDEKLAAGLLGVAKALAYNVASFTWPGWDEPGIEITRSDVLVGLDAARTNLRLAQELDKPDIALSRAHWMLAAAQLALDEYEPTQAGFLRAVDFARKAGEDIEAANSVACARLVAHIADPEDTRKREALDAAKVALEAAGDDGFFSGQIETAERVFAPGR